MLRTEGYRAGDRLPSEQELVARFGVSRPALREAFKLLEEERVVLCQHGVGRFVAPENPGGFSEDITRLTSMTELAGTLGVQFERRVLSVEERAAGVEIGAYLNLDPAARMVVLVRAWFDSSRAVMVSVDHFSRALWNGPLLPEVFQSSLISLLEQNGMARLEYAKSTIHACMLPGPFAHQVGAKRNEPWIRLEQINFTARDVPLLFSQDYYCSERITFRVLRRRR
jgi:GntR family transcriptional regulator